ncbi:hypothetical protein L596_020733 [Steinernema carpocapsae]|nr:hypothetical protein L596_020733 [Steinernema carpocapsae]
MISQFEVKELAVHKEKKENFAQFLKNISTILVGGDGCHLHCYEALKIMKENNMFRHYKAFTMMNFSEDGSEEAVKALKLDDVGYFWLTNWRGHDLKEHAQQLLFNGKLRSLTLLGGNNFISMESFQQYLDRHMDDTTYNIDLLCRVEDVNAFWIRDYRKEKQVDVDKLKPINIQGATTF